MVETITPPPIFVPDAARLRACRQATYQIEGLLEALCKASGDRASGSFPWLAQSVAIRLNELNNVIINALTDAEITGDEIHEALYGPMLTGSDVSREVSHGG